MKLLIALLPSYDMVFPEHAAQLYPAVKDRVLQVNLRIYRRIYEILRDEEIEAVDLLDAMQQDGRVSLFARDFHIFIDGHRLVARVLAEPMRRHLNFSSSNPR
jgi:hypothetical protein